MIDPNRTPKARGEEMTESALARQADQLGAAIGRTLIPLADTRGAPGLNLLERAEEFLASTRGLVKAERKAEADQLDLIKRMHWVRESRRFLTEGDAFLDAFANMHAKGGTQPKYAWAKFMTEIDATPGALRDAARRLDLSLREARNRFVTHAAADQFSVPTMTANEWRLSRFKLPDTGEPIYPPGIIDRLKDLLAPVPEPLPISVDDYYALMAIAWDQAPRLPAKERGGIKEVWASVGFMSPPPADMVRWAVELLAAFDDVDQKRATPT
jgi:hypothetical protein